MRRRKSEREKGTTQGLGVREQGHHQALTTKPVLAQLFRPMIIVLALAGLLISDVAVFRRGSVLRALVIAFSSPIRTF